MADSTKRLNYFDHQFLRQSDFTDEQTYHLNMRRLHNRALHTWGIAQGLEVTFANGASKADISPGIALDSSGREILVPQADQSPDVSGISGYEAYVTLSYTEQATDPTNDTGTTGNTRVTEGYRIDVSATPPEGSGASLILAHLSLQDGKITGVDPGNAPNRRQLASVTAGDLAARSLTFTDPNVVSTSWPSMTGAGGNATLNGNFHVNGGAVINGQANITNGAVISGNSQMYGNMSMMFGALTINNTGTPNRLLHVVGEVFSGGTSGGYGFGDRNLANFVENPTVGERWVWYAAGGVARFWTGDDRWYVRTDGTFGIGVMPGGDCRFDVNGRVRIRQGTSGSAGIWLYQTRANADRAFMGMIDDNTWGLWGTGFGWGLQVNVTNFAARLSGSFTAANFPSPSDGRLKTDITEIPDALDKVSKLRGVTYRGHEDATRQAGVIAQEVKAVLPEAVSTFDDEGHMAVDYGRLAALLVQAVKELREEVKMLRARLEPSTT